MGAEDVSELIAALRSGALTLDDVAQRFRARKWARARRPTPVNPAERAAQLDPGSHVDGSMDDVTAAYDRGEITWEQYRALALAVAASIDAEDASGDNDSEATESSS
jgi:hypothetical protein